MATTSKPTLPGGLTAKHLKAIVRLRDRVEPSDAYESYCWDVSELVTRYLQKLGLDADLCDGAGAVRDYSHTYVLLGDGTIIDPTLDQFYPGGRGNRAGDWTDSIWVKRDREEYGIEDLPSENPWFGEVAVIPVDHPFAQHYWSHRYPARAAGELGEAGHDYWLEQPAWYRALHKLDDLSPPSL